MNCSRTHYSRMIDYSAVENGLSKLRTAAYNYIHGHSRGGMFSRPRKNPVSQKQILKWFHGTPADFVLTALDLLEFEGEKVIREGNKYRVMTFRDKLQQEAR